MPGAGNKGSSSQQRSILSFVTKKENKPQVIKSKSPKFITKGLKKPVTPIQLNRDPIVDEGPIDLTSSPDLLNDHCDDVFNEVSTPLCPDDIKNSNKNIENTEASWLTQIFGKTPQFDSSTSSFDSPDSRPLVDRVASRRNNPVNTPDSPVLGRQHQTTRRGGGGISPLPRQAVSVHSPRKVMPKVTNRNLKFDETKSPWEDDDDDFQDDTKDKGKRRSELRVEHPSGSSSAEEKNIPDFSLNISPQVDIDDEEPNFDIDADVCEDEPSDFDIEEPAFLEENVDGAEAELEVGGTISPPSTPPPCQFLETCPPPNFGVSIQDPPTPTIAESQDIIDPSPEKPMPFSRRFSSTAGRSRLSTHRKISPVSTTTMREPLAIVAFQQPKFEPAEKQSSVLAPPGIKSECSSRDSINNINNQLFQNVIIIMNELTSKVTKTSSYNKLWMKMNEADIQKHKEWKTNFETEFTNFFMMSDFSLSMNSADSESISKVEAAKSCFRRIVSRIEDREMLTQQELEKNTPKSDEKVVEKHSDASSRVRPIFDHKTLPEDAPSWLDYDESPPFEEYSEDENLNHHAHTNLDNSLLNKYRQDSPPPSQVSEDSPPSPILTSRSSTFGSQASGQARLSGAPATKFKFKKPGAGGSAGGLEDSFSRNQNALGGCENYGQVEIPNASFKSPYPGQKQPLEFSSPYPPQQYGTNQPYKETGTQLIEEFNTQNVLPIEIIDDDGYGQEEEEISYDKILYETQKPASSSSKQNDKAKSTEDGKFIGEARNDGKDTFLSSENHPFSKGLRKVLGEKFGMRNFRTNQLQAINSAMKGHDTFVLMPTGGGKSLCYQLPAAFQGGITVVVSPLISLIQDQVTKLNGMNISADHLSGDDYNRQTQIYNQMRGRIPGPTLLYVTPEKLKSSNQLLDALLSVYNQNMLKMFIIDEAHCVSQWGHDFRPDYSRLSLLRTKFPGVPMMALTATATPRVRTDILFQLKMNNPKWFLSSFNRSNLKYEVRQKKGKSAIQEIADLIIASFKRQSGIVYCFSQKDCESAATFLLKAGIKAAPYHAGLGYDLRNKTQNDWVQDKIRVVCATIAFGMGIDKPDVRFVCHQSLPKSIEGYYQESGRAGRDGDPSRCILFYNFSDMLRMRKLIEGNKDIPRETLKIHMDNLWQMVRYAENISDCRRVLQLQYFGEVFDHNRCGEITNMRCDNCTRNLNSNMEKVDISEIGKQVILAVQRISSRSQCRNITLNQFVDVWRGMKNQKTVSSGWDSDLFYGKGKMYSALEANRILKLMVIESYLWESLTISRDGMAIGYLVAGNKAQNLISGQTKLLHLTEGKAGQAKTDEVKDAKESDPELSQMQEDCFNELKMLVLETGRTLQPGKNIKGVYEIIPLQALKQISEKLPTTMDTLSQLEYMTAYRLSLYGECILGITSEYAEMRMDHLASQAHAFQLQREEDDFAMGGEDGFSTPVIQSGGRGRGKARGSGRGKSRYFKKGGGGKRKRSGGQGGSTSKRGRGSGGYTSSRGSASTSRGASASRGRGGGGGTSGSMGMPKRFGVNA